MVKESSSLLNRFSVLKEVGNYAALRRLARSSLENAQLLADERSKVLQILKTTEPEPLVFWLGLGSVAAAAIIAFLLI